MNMSGRKLQTAELHWLNEQLYVNFATRTFIGYAEVIIRSL